MEPPRVFPKVFRAIQTMDVEALASCSDTELRPGKVHKALNPLNLIQGHLNCQSYQDNSFTSVRSFVDSVHSSRLTGSHEFDRLSRQIRELPRRKILRLTYSLTN